ncbi:hypothetical protein Ddye_017742 [Dipteronia dyeriana]|uniref:Uncharacterized protein n=1 Tax=Dipteronia dyeriana TaxID=168575 RepID=A0AAD9X190_9ROSI|nr:hypothetical protein Ddye_017742 [Dipteronia dyeriana]
MDIVGSDVPWLVVRDFNSVLNAHETTGNASTISCDDFRATLTVCDLIKIETNGVFHTRIGRGRRGIVLSRLDRAVCSHSFLTSWSQIACVTLPRSHSDNHLLLVSCSTCISSGTQPFKFQGSGIGDIAMDVTKANEKVMLIQGMIGSEGFSDDLFRLETTTLAYLDIVRKQQEIFFKENSRVKWLAEDLSIIKEHVPSLFTIDENALILRVLSFDEVRSMIFAMDYHCWEIMGQDVVLAMQDVFHTGRVFSGLNSNFLVLISKIQNALFVY